MADQKLTTTLLGVKKIYFWCKCEIDAVLNTCLRSPKLNQLHLTRYLTWHREMVYFSGIRFAGAVLKMVLYYDNNFKRPKAELGKR